MGEDKSYHSLKEVKFFVDTTIRTLPRLYLWAAQLLPDILVKTKAKNANKRNIQVFI
jgi:hypothetical protein